MCDVGLFQRKPRAGEIEDRTLAPPTLPPVFMGGVYPYEESRDRELIVSPCAALRIGTVFACVRVLADTAASLPLIAYRDTPPQAECAPPDDSGACSATRRPPSPRPTSSERWSRT